MGAEEAEAPLCFFTPPIEVLSPTSASPLLKIYNYSTVGTPYCTSTMAYGITRYSFLFFIDTIKPTYGRPIY